MHEQLQGNSIGRTVDGNGNALVKGVTISADKGWDLAKRVKLEIFCRHSFGWLNFDNLDVDVVGLGHCFDSR